MVYTNPHQLLSSLPVQILNAFEYDATLHFVDFLQGPLSIYKSSLPVDSLHFKILYIHYELRTPLTHFIELSADFLYIFFFLTLQSSINDVFSYLTDSPLLLPYILELLHCKTET